MQNLLNQAFQLHVSGNIQEAMGIYIQILPSQQDNQQLLFLLGSAYFQTGNAKEAVAYLQKSLNQNPFNPAAHNNLGLALQELKRLDEALTSYDQAIALKPDYADAYNNRGNALRDLKRPDEALTSYDQAIALKPDYAEAYNNRGNALQNLKRFDAALTSYDQAIALKPDYAFLLGNIQHLQMHLCQWDDFDTQLTALLNKIMLKERASTPFPLLALIDAPAIHQVASRTYIDEKFPVSVDTPQHSGLSKTSKIRIAYFSADFHNHATMLLMAEVFEQHDRDQFEIIAFSFGSITNDAWELRAKKAFDQFIDCHAKSDGEVALLSQTLGIDIAIDLKGFTTDSRTGIFAHRAAPIQVNFLGYPGTMGADYIDYLIADEVIIPKELQCFYTEKIAYLPDCYQPNCRSIEISSEVLTRAALGLPENAIVFCSFNNNYKITPQLFASWIRILKEVKGSVLWLLATNPTAEKNLRRYLEQDGIEPDRLIFANKIPIEDHFSRMRMADIMLDTFPYGAHTTCSDALRMELPVITMMGESFASRVAASLLTTAGLPELITHTLTEYENLAIELAGDPKKLGKIRSKLKKKVMSSSLFDSQRFTRNLESLYDTMYKRKKKGLAVDHINKE